MTRADYLHYVRRVNMARASLKLFLFLIIGFHAVSAFAGRGTVPVARFTPEEKQFLQDIAKKASEIVGQNLKVARYQLDCTIRLGTSNECIDSKQIMEAVKTSYAAYRTYFVMSEYSYYLSRIRGRATAANPQRPVPLATDYSTNRLYIPFSERERIKTLRTDDDAFIAKMKESCGANYDRLVEHYQRQLSQIITLVPVVLMIQTKTSFPTDEEVIAGYEQLVENIESTYKNFTTYDTSDLDGLWGYQLIAQALVKENPARKAIYDRLVIKIEPQGALEHIGAWISKTFFSYNILFIGCTVVAIVTVNPVIAMACVIANTLMASYNLYSNVGVLAQRRAEWVSGANDFTSVETAKVQTYVDIVMLGLNIGAGSIVAKNALATPLFNAEFHREMIRANLKNEVLREKAKTYVKDLLRDQTEGEGKNLVGGLIIGGVQYFIDNKDIERISQASSEILIEFRKKGIFTYKDNAGAICNAMARADSH